MDRLTNTELASALENGYFVSIDRKTVSVPTVEDVYIKLSKYEKIEEELGIDLITLLKAMQSQKMYVKLYSNDNKIVEWNEENNTYANIVWDIPNGNVYFYWSVPKETEHFVASISDYGKTWALTREELKDDR